MYGYTTFHDSLMNNLIQSVRDGRSSHAYIFEGDAGLGLLSCAKLFAAALTCPNKASAPCGSCPSCIQAGADTNPDIIYVEKPKDRKTIGVEPIRRLNADAAIRPFSSARKVYIITEGGIMTEEAQNALLKTLEEPPEYAAIIIIVENSSVLLPTVLSRSSLIHFPPVSDGLIERYVREKYPNELHRLEFLKRYCGGIPGVIDNIIADENFEPLRSAALGKLEKLLSPNRLDAYAIRLFIDENKDETEKILDFWISYLRDMLALRFGADGSIINVDKTESLGALSDKYDPNLAVIGINELLTAKKMLFRYVNPSALSLRAALKIRV